ncbi:MAG: hypothetical protein IKB68_05830, partial [Rikenellaceae bacterium]|nr:hypothetical protein [Rikenellaceae bacterium]
MSRILITACAIIFTTSALFAQQPTADSIATEPKQARWTNVIKGDSLLALAGANGKLDYAVFGQVARNDEQYNALVKIRLSSSSFDFSLLKRSLAIPCHI